MKELTVISGRWSVNHIIWSTWGKLLGERLKLGWWLQETVRIRAVWPFSCQHHMILGHVDRHLQIWISYKLQNASSEGTKCPNGKNLHLVSQPIRIKRPQERWRIATWRWTTACWLQSLSALSTISIILIRSKLKHLKHSLYDKYNYIYILN